MSEKKVDPNLIIAVGLIVVVFFGGRKIFQFLGLIDTKEDKKEEQALNQLQNYSFWNFDNFFATMPIGSLTLTSFAASEYAEQIYDATGYFNDDEEAIYGVFRACKTQAQMAMIAKRFFILYSKDLYSFLDEYLNDSEMYKLQQIISSKPKYNV